MPRKIHAALVFIFLAGLSTFAHGQDAQIQGRVSDSTGAVIPKAVVRVVNLKTNIAQTTVTNGAGQYVVAGLTPSQYQIDVTATGFSQATSNVITLSVAQDAVLDFKLKIGSASTRVVVNGNSASINTSDASVSTVIDRKFVQDIPLNGRSFQSLILLAPGVVTSSPQGNDDGGFSVDGERTNANHFLVDGVSAENAGGDWGGTSTSGMNANATALGTTQSMLPVDAMQEFRISTSTYSAEYGRQPGAQIIIQSRSGTNQYHGDLYDYIRNYAFDANDWFNTYTTPIIARPAERQNDFGGSFGGPISIPRVFSGKNRLFLFFAYEGLRLTLPENATIYYVPSNGTLNISNAYANPKYKNLRKYVPAALQPVMNAFPEPNCVASASQVPSGATGVTVNSQCVDYGDGMNPYLFNGAWPAYVNTISARVDYQLTPGTRVFARYGDSPGVNELHVSVAPSIQKKIMRTRVYLLGADSVIHGTLTNEFRLQYSPSVYLNSFTPDLTGGAQFTNLNTLQGLPPIGGESFFEFDFQNEEPKLYSLNYGTLQYQPNIVDNVSWTHGTQLFTAGVDYRYTTTYINDGQYARTPGAYTYFKNAAELVENKAYEIKTNNAGRQDLTSKNLGLFFQDEWRATPRLTVNAGLRWDFNPSPTVKGMQQYTYSGHIDDPSSLSLSALGAPFYANDYTDFQPRLGVAYLIHTGAGEETVLRAGGGLFYGLIAANEFVGNASSTGIGNVQLLKGVPFPVTAEVINAPPTYPPAPPYTLEFIIDPHVVSPSSVHWNVSLEQALGQHQTFTLGYVGSTGRNLIDEEEYSLSKINPLFTAILQYQNGPGSSYNSLQAHYQRRAFRGLQFMASYTWAHAIDWSSNDDDIEPMQKGNSNHDVRNNFTAALVYSLPSFFENPIARQLASHWNLDLLGVARSAFPVEQAGATLVDPATGNEYVSRLNYNGQYPYVRKPGIPGGRQINPAVFSVPTAAQNGNGNAPRNFLRGFREAAVDAAIQREFPLREQLVLQFRAEAFNVFNHPNFGALNVTCGTSTNGAACNNPLMGQATDTLSTALSSAGGDAGMSSLYQQGGPRSLQFALKLQF